MWGLTTKKNQKAARSKSGLGFEYAMETLTLGHADEVMTKSTEEDEWQEENHNARCCSLAQLNWIVRSYDAYGKYEIAFIAVDYLDKAYVSEREVAFRFIGGANVADIVAFMDPAFKETFATPRGRLNLLLNTPAVSMTADLNDATKLMTLRVPTHNWALREWLSRSTGSSAFDINGFELPSTASAYISWSWDAPQKLRVVPFLINCTLDHAPTLPARLKSWKNYMKIEDE